MADDRKARFVCVTTLAQDGRAVAVLSDSVEGVIAKSAQGGPTVSATIPCFSFPNLVVHFAETHA